ncbi:hypothetical protein MWH28_01905 [Natroniella sulfidigena]|nr:hypothetical protein [Natroniella sulfidigena]MCK8816118.1 hypothetical protein [Natroniella sulfidigena]
MKKALLLLIVLIAVGIILFDVGNSGDHSSGAGEIWWTEVEEVEQNF